MSVGKTPEEIRKLFNIKVSRIREGVTHEALEFCFIFEIRSLPKIDELKWSSLLFSIDNCEKL